MAESPAFNARCAAAPKGLFVRAEVPILHVNCVRAYRALFTAGAWIGAFKLKDYGIPGLLQDSGRDAYRHRG